MSLIILASDVSSTGGIERVVRDLISICAKRWRPEEITLLTVHPHPLGEIHGVRVMSPSPIRQSGARVPPSRQLAYAHMTLRVPAHAKKVDAILCMHVNLAFLAWMMHARTSAPYSVAAYGVDVWGSLPAWDSIALRRAQRVWSISNFTSEQLHRQHRVDPRRIRAWPLGLSPDDEWHKQGQTPRPGAPTVVTVARLTRRNAYKGVDTLISSWPHVLRRVPQARLHIVGDGDHLSALKRLSSLVGVEDSVDFLGALTDQQRNQAYRDADVFALPGRADLGRVPEGEGFGLVFLEAQAFKLPVVAGAAGGAPEALLPGITGLLADPDDPLDVADRIATLLEDPIKSREMGEAGHRWVTAERTPETARAVVVQLLDDLGSR